MQEEHSIVVTRVIERLPGCQCACGGWTWVSGCGSCAGALHCRTYCEIADDRTSSGTEIGCSAGVSRGGNGTCVDTNIQHLAASKDRLAKRFSNPLQLQTNCHSPRLWPGPRPRFRAGVRGAIFWAGRRASRGAARWLPRVPWTHAPGCRARLLNEPHTPTHFLEALVRDQTWKFAEVM